MLAILRALSRLRHSLRLGGQHGEEAKDEGSEEGDEEEDPEEEVVRCYFTIFDLALMSMIASNGPAAPDRR